MNKYQKHKLKNIMRQRIKSKMSAKIGLDWEIIDIDIDANLSRYRKSYSNTGVDVVSTVAITDRIILQTASYKTTGNEWIETEFSFDRKLLNQGDDAILKQANANVKSFMDNVAQGFQQASKEW